MDKNLTYIVTGCTGYVGNVITKKLQDLGCNVIGLARSEEKAKKVFKDNPPTIIYGDIRNKSDLEKLFIGNGPFVIFHTVAYVSIGEADQKELYDVTVGGTQNMIDVSLNHNIHKFFHISSTEALPHKFKLEPDLSNYIPTPKKARKGYNRAKSEADVIVLKAVKEHNLPASLILLAGVLGPGDYSNSHMTQVMIDYINGKLPASVNGGYNDFDIRDVTDVLPEIIKNARTNESYLFANKPDKINEVIHYVSEFTNRKMLPTLPMWTAYVGLPFLWLASKITKNRPLYTSASLASLRADTNFPLDKVKNEFGYNPRPLKETVEDHIKFLIEEGYVKL
ncbi:MAG: NAD-dependent epimerase/dehydratase family protein [Acholeplasmatales bacterium]|nr:NAD-dependent epimerase/dehydratase family protein [Acholeplasmatales bacterium]